MAATSETARTFTGAAGALEFGAFGPLDARKRGRRLRLAASPLDSQGRAGPRIRTGRAGPRIRSGRAGLAWGRREAGETGEEERDKNQRQGAGEGHTQKGEKGEGRVRRKRRDGRVPGEVDRGGVDGVAALAARATRAVCARPERRECRECLRPCLRVRTHPFCARRRPGTPARLARRKREGIVGESRRAARGQKGECVAHQLGLLGTQRGDGTQVAAGDAEVVDVHALEQRQRVVAHLEVAKYGLSQQRIDFGIEAYLSEEKKELKRGGQSSKLNGLHS